MVLGFKEEQKRRRKRSVRLKSISMPCSDDDDELPIASLIAKIKKPKKKIQSGGGNSSKQSSRKSRSKIRKPKYLSLRLQFSSCSDQRSEEESTQMASPDDYSGSKQLQLFPVHPEEKEAHDENMAYLLSAADGGASTLTGLLESNTNTNGSCTSDHHNQENIINNNNDSSGTGGTTTLSPSGSLTYARDEEVALVRTALRSKEREPSEERWVRYSEVVERREDQEVSSCTAVPETATAGGRWKRNQRLSLKLDYEEILTAWSNKGSLFIHAAYAEAAPPQSPQIVPDLHNDDLLVSHFPTGMISNGWGNDPSYVWRVPEFTVPGLELGHNLVRPKIEEQQEQGVVPAELMVGVGGDQWKMEQREASVKRYKEKRQNRLFSKRIRYQVRKLNAEKRPRIKGRFVKS
ncbi:OLC1v1011320C1 [Oldenlandia corymbosa var. corymbosa]|uniref:OLC1v1011320C1 n=1 Tax=Oldenlandia corymbosa var. corymbosa TaxID=529605 RepID=A0AAV1DV31_OLDCO|nr:OLC1v1011320C1 [Oldenlandia corymbosa var. corymbosa]